MKTIYFKCTLLTDVVLNQKAATEGNQESLDFIPGNNFLGIAASVLYKNLNPEESLKLFHSKSVRFGDAHPAVFEKDGNIIRALRIPASYYKAKLGNHSGFYIYHEVEDKDTPEYVNFQPKQCRTGFYTFQNESLKEIDVDKSFAIKSAYDRESRRSKDAKIFGYESLQAGSDWIFSINMEDVTFENAIIDALSGTRRIGRSRTAQYGLVEIEEIATKVEEITVLDNNPEHALVYADSRLIFFDDYGLPTFQPKAEDFGFKNGEIDWTKTQIRTFQYAPWNSIRQARDTDRCGIEKGSVFFIRKKNEAKELTYPNNYFVGKYQNEGFGKIIINPAFLQTIHNSNGKALFTIAETDKKEEKGNKDILTNNTPLFQFLIRKNEREEREEEIYRLVNEFVDNSQNFFLEETFASQWGSIRSITMRTKNRNDLKRLLFDEEIGYLMHGIAYERWNERGRLRKFKVFFDNIFDRTDFSDKDVCFTIINLSAEMAKLKGEK